MTKGTSVLQGWPKMCGFCPPPQCTRVLLLTVQPSLELHGPVADIQPVRMAWGSWACFILECCGKMSGTTSSTWRSHMVLSGPLQKLAISQPWLHSLHPPQQVSTLGHPRTHSETSVFLSSWLCYHVWCGYCILIAYYSLKCSRVGSSSA